MEKKRSEKYLIKNIVFDISSLADQFYQLRSTFLEGLKPEKIYFSENLALNLLSNGMKALLTQIKTFNQSLKKNKIENDAVDNLSEISKLKFHLIKLNTNGGINKAVNKFFFQPKKK